jgi:hypothetical protein
MNIVPSVVAAGVAQTGLQAQQLGRRRAARAQQAYRQTRQIQETAAIHLRAVEENDEGAAAGVHVSITGQLPEHHTPDSDQTHHARHGSQAKDHVVEAIEADATDAEDASENDPMDGPRHAHVDVQA